MKQTGGSFSTPVPAVGQPGIGETAAPGVRRQVLTVLAALVLAVTAFSASYVLEREFDRLWVFEQFDVLFDADPSMRLRGFAHGWEHLNRSLIHPNLANFINPPIRFLARGLHLAGVAEGDIMETRRALGLLVIPTVSGLQAAAWLLLFHFLGCGLFPAVLLSLLGAVSFSQIIYGSVPDHFALSNLLLTLSFFLFIDLARRGEIRWPAWIGLGWLATGITVTNLLVIAFLFWAALALRRTEARRSMREAAVLTATVAVLTYASYGLLNLGYDDDSSHPPHRTLAWTGHFLRNDPLDNLRRFPTAVADAIAPTEPDVVPVGFLWPRGSYYDIRFTLKNAEKVFTSRNLLGTAVLIALILGAAAHLRAGGSLRILAWGASGILAFNALLHAAWGKEYFLYSQHWLTASLLLLAGIVLTGGPWRRLATMVLALLLLFTALNNWLNLQIVLETLRAV